MVKVLFVGAGGFCGAILRYVLSGYVQQCSKSAEFPYGTMAVNLIGCLLIGFGSQLAETRGAFGDEARVFIFIGVLGGFTTFSSFGNETMNLLRASESIAALLNVAAHIVLGLGSVWLGRVLAHLLWR